MTDQAVHPDAEVWGGWSWQAPDRGEHFRRCSHCGGINPEDLAAEPEWLSFSWADRKYGWPHKFYVDLPNRNPERLYVVSATNSPPSRSAERYVAWADLTDEQREVVKRDGWIRDDHVWGYYEFGTRPTHFGKFYTIHLSDSELSPALKRLIEFRSGLEFDFTDGRVQWRPITQWDND